MLGFEAAKPLVVNGTTLATWEKGAGDSLVLVHGSASDARTWSNQFDVLAERHRTIAYSRRFHVPNSPIPADAPDPIEAHVTDLMSLVGILDAAPAHVVGHSWGGLVSLLAADRAPDLFRSLVLIEPPTISMHLRVPPSLPQLIGLMFRQPRLALEIVKFGAGTVGPSEKAFQCGEDKQAVERFGRGVLGDRYFDALSDERYSQVWENRGPDRALALHHGFPDLTGKDFSNFRGPILLIVGKESPPLFRALIEALRVRLSDTTLREIANASHISHENAPEAVNSAILEFLDSID